MGAVQPSYKLVTHGPDVAAPVHTFVRDRHHHEGTVFKAGQLSRTSEDRQRGFDVANIDGSRKLVLGDEADAEAPSTVDELLGAHIDLTGETEGKPDTIATYGVGGVTLGAGFTGPALVKLIFDFKTGNPDASHRLFGQYGFEAMSKSTVKLTIPNDEFGDSFLARNRSAPLPPDLEKGVTLDASEALQIVARDDKLIHVFADAAFDPEFRAYFAAWFASKLEVSLSAKMGKFSWEELGRKSPYWDMPDFRTAWTLPFMHLATAGRESVDTASEYAADCARAAQRDHGLSTSSLWAPAWWGASYQLRHSPGKRDERLLEMGKGTAWWAALTDPKWEAAGKTDEARSIAAAAKKAKRDAEKAAKAKR